MKKPHHRTKKPRKPDTSVGPPKLTRQNYHGVPYQSLAIGQLMSGDREFTRVSAKRLRNVLSFTLPSTNLAEGPLPLLASVKAA